MINTSGIRFNGNILKSAKKPQQFIISNNNQQCGVLQQSSPSIDTYKATVKPSFKGAIPERFIHVWLGGELPEFNVKNWLRNSSMEGHENFQTLFITDDVAKTRNAFHKHLGKICSDVVKEKSELIKSLKADLQELSKKRHFLKINKKKKIQKQIEEESNSLKTMMDNVSALKKKLGIIGENSAPNKANPKKAGIVSVDEFFNNFTEFAKANGNFTPKEVEMLKAAVLRETNGHHKNLAAASDILRNMALFVHGGHYLDGDVRVLKSLKEINTPKHGVFYRQGLLHSTFGSTASDGGNAEISAVKGNELIQACLKDIIKSYKKDYSFSEKRTGLLELKKEVQRIFAEEAPEDRKVKLIGLFNAINNKSMDRAIKKEDIPENLHGFLDRLSKFDETGKSSIGNLTSDLWIKIALNHNELELTGLEKQLSSRAIPTMKVSGPDMIRDIISDTSRSSRNSRQKLAYPDNTLFSDNCDGESFSQSPPKALQRSHSVSDLSTDIEYLFNAEDLKKYKASKANNNDK